MSNYVEFDNPPIAYLNIPDHCNAYVVGDIHGCYDELMTELNRINFDKSKDILIGVGDLIDRGKDSAKLIQLLDQPWFVSTLGNHEQFCMQGNVSYNYEVAHSNERSGGEWFYKLPINERNAISARLLNLPIMMEINYRGKKYGIVHADIPIPDWELLKIAVINNDLYTDGRTVRNHCLWARNLVHKDYINVKGIDRIYLGHSVIPYDCQINDIKNVGNCTFIDTGVVFGLWLSIVKLGDTKVC